MGGGASVVIAEDTNGFPSLGVSLSYCSEFFALCGGKDALKGLTTSQVCEQYVKPATASSSSSFCAWLGAQGHPGVGKAQVFISHAWSFLFLDVIEALVDHFEHTPDIIIWFDLFSNNQHHSEENPFEWWCDVFKSSIANMQHVVMVLAPWHSPVPLKRAWCLFELYCSAQSHCRFEIAMSRSQEKEFLKAIEVNTEQEIKRLFSHIDCANSEATVHHDKTRIFEVVKKTVGFDSINSMVFQQLRQWMIATAERAVHEHHLHAHDPLKVALDEATGDLMEENPTNRIIAQVETELALGSLYVSQAKFADAEPIFLDCLQLAKSELGHDHPCTNATRNNLAVLYDAQQKYEDAEDLLLLVLKLNQLSQQKFDEEQTKYKEERAKDTRKHIDLRHSIEKEEEEAQTTKFRLCDERLTTMNNLASVYMSQGKLDLALDLYQACYQERRVSLVVTSETVFTTINEQQLSPRSLKDKDNDSKLEGSDPSTEGLGGITEKSMKLRTSHNPSMKYNSSSLSESQRQSYQEELFSMMNNLATVYEKLQRYEEAETILLECILEQRKLLGEEHLDTLMTEANLAGIFFSQGKYTDAEPLLIIVLDKRRVLLGEEHPLTLATMQSLAMTYFSLARYAEAEALLIPCLELRKQLLGEDHPHTIDTISTLAMVFNQQDKQEEAEIFFVMCYETQRRTFGEDNPEALEYMSNLAIFYDNSGDKKKAESLARECWSLCIQYLGPEHPLAFNLTESFPYLLDSIKR